MVTNRPSVPAWLPVRAVASVTQSDGNEPRVPFIDHFCRCTKQDVCYWIFSDWSGDQGVRTAPLVEYWTHDGKVASSSPGRRILFSRVNFLCWLFIQSPFHPSVTAVACKRQRSLCQKCRWQVTPKHAHSLDPTKSEVIGSLWTDSASRMELVCESYLYFLKKQTKKFTCKVKATTNNQSTMAVKSSVMPQRPLLLRDKWSWRSGTLQCQHGPWRQGPNSTATSTILVNFLFLEIFKTFILRFLIFSRKPRYLSPSLNSGKHICRMLLSSQACHAHGAF